MIAKLPTTKNEHALEWRGHPGQPNLHLETARSQIGREQITPIDETFICQHHALPEFASDSWSVISFPKGPFTSAALTWQMQELPAVSNTTVLLSCSVLRMVVRSSDTRCRRTAARTGSWVRHRASHGPV